MTLTYNYLLTTILVGYLLKTKPQNYDLVKQKKTGTKAKTICMITPDVEDCIAALLRLYYDEVKVVPYIAWSNVYLPENIVNDPNKFIRVNDVSKGNIKKRHMYNKVMTKLHIFNPILFPYEKVIFLD